MASSRPIADAVFGLLFECGFDPAFIVERGLDHQVVAANQRFEELVGRRAADVIGLPRVVARLGHYAEQCKDRHDYWRAADLLSRLAAGGHRFADA